MIPAPLPPRTDHPPVPRGIVVALVLLAAFFRLWQLGDQSLWLDEAYTAQWITQGVRGILRAIAQDLDTPPLHPLIVYAFAWVAGTSELTLRLPSALASILAVPLTFVLARRLLGQRIGLLATLAMAMAPFAIYYAQEARMYSMMLLFTVASSYALTRALDAPHKATWWAAFTASSAAGIYTHFFGFLVLGLEELVGLGYAVVLWRRHHPGASLVVRGLALSTLATAILYLPWLPVLLHFLQENYTAVPYGQGWRANLSWTFAAGTVMRLAAGTGVSFPIYLATLALMTLGTLWLIRQGQGWLVLVIALWLALPYVLIAMANPGHFLSYRYFIFQLPATILVTGAGLEAFIQSLGRFPWPSHGRWAPTAAAIAVALALAAPGWLSYVREPPKPEWRPLGRYITERIPPNDMVVAFVFPHWDTIPLQHYLRLASGRGVIARRIVYASEDPYFVRTLRNETGRPWWIIFGIHERRLEKRLHRTVGPDFRIVTFNYLAILHREREEGTAVEDAQVIMRAILPVIPPPYKGEGQRVLTALIQGSDDAGHPGPPPMPISPPPLGLKDKER